MPSIRRRERVRRADLDVLTDGQRLHLLDGYTFFGDGFTDADTYREAWEMHGDELMAEWMKEHVGCRPFGWWFCRGEERPVINEKATARDIELARQSNRNEHFGFMHTNWWPRLQESERSYLTRLGLLTPEELAVLEARDAEEERRWAEDDARYPNASREYREATEFTRNIRRTERS